MILICILNCSNWMKKPSRTLPSTLSPHTNVQAKPPDSWPRVQKITPVRGCPCSGELLFLKCLTQPLFKALLFQENGGPCSRPSLFRRMDPGYQVPLSPWKPGSTVKPQPQFLEWPWKPGSTVNSHPHSDPGNQVQLWNPSLSPPQWPWKPSPKMCMWEFQLNI